MMSLQAEREVRALLERVSGLVVVDNPNDPNGADAVREVQSEARRLLRAIVPPRPGVAP